MPRSDHSVTTQRAVFLFLTGGGSFSHTGIVAGGFSVFSGFFPNWRRNPTTPVVRLCTDDLAHGVVEGQAEDLDMEVNGVAGEVAFGPAPVAVFDDETGMGGRSKVVRLARDELEAALLEQWHQRC